MNSTENPSPHQPPPDQQKKQERRLFVFIIVFLFPLLAVAFVGAYGFTIWMYQLLAGPPGGG